MKVPSSRERMGNQKLQLMKEESVVPAPKLSSPSFVERIFDRAWEDSHTESGLVRSSSICISLLDPKRAVSSLFSQSIRNQHMYKSHISVNPEAVGAMLSKLSDLLMLLKCVI